VPILGVMGEHKDIALGIDFRSETTSREGASEFDPMVPRAVNATDNRGTYEIESKEWCPEHFISFKRSHMMSLGPGEFPGRLENSVTDGVSEEGHDSKFALIILNLPIELELEVFSEIWKKGIFVVIEVG
jgi:hypothetical protein